MAIDLDALTQPFPKGAVKQRAGGGGRAFDYVEGHTVINRLNTATGNNWNFTVLSTWREGDVLFAHVELEIPGHGKRQHIGVQRLQQNSGEDMAKGAVTDALKKAATLFGVALELYGPDYEAASAPPNRPQQRPPANGGMDTREVVERRVKVAFNAAGLKGADARAKLCEVLQADVSGLNDLDTKQLLRVAQAVERENAEQAAPAANAYEQGA